MAATIRIKCDLFRRCVTLTQSERDPSEWVAEAPGFIPLGFHVPPQVGVVDTFLLSVQQVRRPPGMHRTRRPRTPQPPPLPSVVEQASEAHAESPDEAAVTRRRARHASA